MACKGDLGKQRNAMQRQAESQCVALHLQLCAPRRWLWAVARRARCSGTGSAHSAR